MAFYIVKDQSEKLHVVEAIGFVPEGVLCLAPVGATTSDGDCVVVSEVGGKVVASLDLAKKATKDAAEAAKAEQTKVNAEAEAYLSITDWLIIREIDTGEPCPPEVKYKRAEMRAKIVR